MRGDSSPEVVDTLGQWILTTICSIFYTENMTLRGIKRPTRKVSEK